MHVIVVAVTLIPRSEELRAKRLQVLRSCILLDLKIMHTGPVCLISHVNWQYESNAELCDENLSLDTLVTADTFEGTNAFYMCRKLERYPGAIMVEQKLLKRRSIMFFW